LVPSSSVRRRRVASACQPKCSSAGRRRHKPALLREGTTAQALLREGTTAHFEPAAALTPLPTRDARRRQTRGFLPLHAAAPLGIMDFLARAWRGEAIECGGGCGGGGPGGEKQAAAPPPPSSMREALATKQLNKPNPRFTAIYNRRLLHERDVGRGSSASAATLTSRLVRRRVGRGKESPTPRSSLRWSPLPPAPDPRPSRNPLRRTAAPLSSSKGERSTVILRRACCPGQRTITVDH
jgi:hypothetical protein